MTDADLFAELRRLLSDRGAALVGCADLEPLPPEVREELPRAVSIGVALAPSIVAGNVDGPTVDYAAEYARVNALLNRLAEDAAGLLRRSGHRAVAVGATVEKLDLETLATSLPHKTVATRAGLGWVGKCALLITKGFGAAVRLSTVLTDASLKVGKPVEASRCGECTECVEVCPAGAPSGRHWQAGQRRESFFDAFACCRMAQQRAGRIGSPYTICGICIAVCPHTKRYTDGRPHTG